MCCLCLLRRYTCFDASPNYVAFGSSTGGLYLYKREPGTLEFVKNLPMSGGKVTCIAFCAHDEQLIAFSTSTGTLTVVELRAGSVEAKSAASAPAAVDRHQQHHQQAVDSNLSCETIYVANNFTCSAISVLRWDTLPDYRLLIADRAGRLFMVHRLKALHLSHLLVSPEPTLILTTTAPISTLDVSGSTVIVSTLERAILYDIDTAEVCQVGKRGRPVGEYAACLYPRDNEPTTVYHCVYAARPGCRIWEADLKGNVHFTHQFRNIIEAPDPVHTVDGTAFVAGEDNQRSTPTFSRFFLVTHRHRHFLLAYAHEQRALFLIDPVRASVLLWTPLHDNIDAITCVGADVFIMSADRNHLHFSQMSVAAVLDLVHMYASARMLSQLNNFLDLNRDKLRNLTADYREKTKLTHAFQKLWQTMSQLERAEHPDLCQQPFLDRELITLFESNEQLAPSSTPEPVVSADIVHAYESHQEYQEYQEYHHPTDDIEARYFKLSLPIDHVSIGKFIPFGNGTSTIISKGIEKLSLSTAKHGLDLVLTKAPVLNRVASFVKPTSLEQSQEKSTNANMADATTTTNAAQQHDQPKEESASVSIETQLSDPDQVAASAFDKDINIKSPPEVPINVNVEPEPVTIPQLIDQIKRSKEAIKCRCECGYPTPGAHLYQTAKQQELEKMLHDQCDQCDQRDQERDVLTASFEAGLWRLHLNTVFNRCDWNTFAKLFLALSDAKLFEPMIAHLSSVQARDVIAQLVNLWPTLRNDGDNSRSLCVNCGHVLGNANTIGVEELANLAIKCLGAREGCAILRQHSDRLPFNELPINFYLSVVRREIVTKYQSELTLSKMNKLNEKLCKKSA